MQLTSPSSSFALSHPSGLSLAALGLSFALQFSDYGTNALNVTWISPASGDVYGPGAYILGEWQAPAAIDSPSFQLCMDTGGTGPDQQNGNDVCGSPVQPTVQQDADSGAYQIITGQIPPVAINATFAAKFAVPKGALDDFKMLDLKAEVAREYVSGEYATYTGFNAPGDASVYTRIDFVYGDSTKRW